MYKHINIYINIRDRQTWGQACWRESGGRGTDTLAPLPWVTLLLSFCALVSLQPPSSPRPSPPLPAPYSGHTPLLLLISSSPSLSSSGRAETMPKHFHEQRGTWRDDLMRDQDWKKKKKRKLSPFGLYWKAAVAVDPHPGAPCSLDAHRLPVPPLSQKIVKRKNTHWLTPMAASSRPERSPTGLKTVWAWSVLIFFLLSFYFSCVLTLFV